MTLKRMGGNMPRIYSSESNPLDFCNKCFPGEEAAEVSYGNQGDGPDGRGNCFAYDAMHPPYDEQYPAYRCEKCNKKLTDDNA